MVLKFSQSVVDKILFALNISNFLVLRRSHVRLLPVILNIELKNHQHRLFLDLELKISCTSIVKLQYVFAFATLYVLSYIQNLKIFKENKETRASPDQKFSKKIISITHFLCSFKCIYLFIFRKGLI